MEYEFEEDSADYNYKIILIGDSQVGKTSITSKYVNDDFDEL